MMDEASLSLGPVFVAVLLNTLVYGICIVQFFNYYTSGVKDPLLIRLLVAYELCVDSFHSCAGAYIMWYWCITNYNNPSNLTVAPWAVSAIPIITACSACPIQLFLSWRIKLFSQSWITFIVLSTLSIAQGILAFAAAVQAFQIQYTSDFQRVIPLVAVWLSLSVALDLTITCLLTYHLNKSRTGVHRTDGVIFKIIRLSVETAAVVTGFSILDLVSFVAYPSLNFHLIWALPSGRLYTNTLLLTLNVRTKLRKQMLAIQELGVTEILRSDGFNLTAPTVGQMNLHIVSQPSTIQDVEAMPTQPHDKVSSVSAQADTIQLGYSENQKLDPRIK